MRSDIYELDKISYKTAGEGASLYGFSCADIIANQKGIEYGKELLQKERSEGSLASKTHQI
ncbi:hypothetical protein [Campylobacter troglodytis]|uniref:hypothetical protein n=1 Tax=Campylobacter troglodytis TaxID=654363 RepID=UPI00115C1DAA|nr:hypothetical protein [Campylobacter troglodytis]TQR48706.1 hypothetical protein DMC01_13035 [Campylobacter troglodytis]